MPKQSKVSQAGPKEDRAELAKRRSSLLTILRENDQLKHESRISVMRIDHWSIASV